MCEAASSRWRKEASRPVSRSADMPLGYVSARAVVTSKRKAELIVRRPRCDASSSRPATRTPSRRTGRRGSRRRSRSSATVPTAFVSFTAASRLRARVTVVKSSKRTLMPIVRPRRSSRASVSQSSSGEPLEHGLELGEAVEVAVEGGLARLRLRDPHRLDARGRPRSGRARPGAGRAGGRTTRMSWSSGVAPSAAERGDAELLEPRDGLRADAGHEPGRGLGEADAGPPRPSAPRSRPASRRPRRPSPRACSGRSRPSR